MILPAVQRLLDRGVVMPCPAAVEVGDDVSPDRIAPGVVIHTGCKIFGKETSIGPDCELGGEMPATVEDCCLGKGVKLAGGYFAGSVFLDKSSMGSGAHVRAGTLLEDEANGAHTVGLKQTIFLPFVTAGSLINFCDALMAGGTSRKHHSEIGSSYIHFNYTPHGDKATPSLIGDVPRGVMLDQSPIFLGGQGGLVGPVRIEYGCVIPAGVIYRWDALEKDSLLLPHQPSSWGPRPYRMGAYHGVHRMLANNLIYLGNIFALQAWYRLVRLSAMSGDPYSKACCAGAMRVLESVRAERVKRLKDLAERLKNSIEWLSRQSMTHAGMRELACQKAFVEQWPETEAVLSRGASEAAAAEDREAFLNAWQVARKGHSYIEAIKSLEPEARRAGTAWLQAIVDEAAALCRPPDATESGGTHP
ncbi:MAG: UDP-N-acetylglucosamine pyrophosphorylase [Kiritimatiellae bacterium]|nr:UDP-N-acetylglucosamine pyrophosphorylase [Kiritimatiellia bacterium]